MTRRSQAGVHASPRAAAPLLTRALTLGAALALVAAAALAGAPSAMADGNPNVDVATLADPTLDDAMINILINQGINYEPITDPQSAANGGGPDTTLVIDNDEVLDPTDLSRLQNQQFGRIVILSTDPQTLSALVPLTGLTTSQEDAPADITPDCTTPNPTATSAGAIESPGPTNTYTYLDQDTASQSCYPVQGSPSLVEIPAGPANPDIILLGSDTFFEDQYLADDGNADLAMRIFGAHTNLVWLATSFTNDSALNCPGNSNQCAGNEGSGGNGGNGGGTTTTVSPGPGNSASPPTLSQLLPKWIWWVLAQIALAVLLVAYWRARRHGRIVAEPLPVTVRAAETVEGHARLYRRAGAYGHSAQLLRRAAAGRLAPIFGLPQARAESNPELLVQPIAARLGVDPGLVGELLAGPAPTSEPELVLLADHLDLLEQEVRSS
jgi:hypothetical protein